MGSDFAGIVKARAPEEAQAESLQLEGFDIPAEDQFIDWLQKNLSYLESQLHKGVTLGEAVEESSILRLGAQPFGAGRT